VDEAAIVGSVIVSMGDFVQVSIDTSVRGTMLMPPHVQSPEHPGIATRPDSQEFGLLFAANSWFAVQHALSPNPPQAVGCTQVPDAFSSGIEQ
jgi:hypothetical protein